jgi:hypothetical protein
VAAQSSAWAKSSGLLNSPRDPGGEAGHIRLTEHDVISKTKRKLIRNRIIVIHVTEVTINIMIADY